jgi:hypothetical protein
MSKMPLRFRKAPLVFLGATSLLCLGTPLHGQTTASPGKPAQTDDASRREIDNFNRFLEGHQNIAVQLHSTPWLVDNYNYLQTHPELKQYLQDHPGVKEAISQNPVAFMKEDAQSSELAQFSRFLDTHREIAEQLRNNPTLADNTNFLESHPELKTYLDQHQAVKQALRDNAVTFMKEEDGFNRDAGGRDQDRYARTGDVDRDRGTGATGRDRDADARSSDQDRDRDANRRNGAQFDQFLDSHREIAEQVRRNPSLVNDRQFVQNHPALQTFLQNNPGVRDDLRRDPNAFMDREANNERAESQGDRDPVRNHMADFGGFLDNHRDIARDLNRNPAAVQNKEFVQNRPDLDDYLHAHPDVRNDLMANPQSFVKGAQQMSTSGSGSGTTGSGSGSGSTGTSSTTGGKIPGDPSQAPPPAPKTK